MQTINNAIISVLFSKDIKYYSGFELLSALVTTAVCRGSTVSQNPLWRLLKDHLKQERKTHSKCKNSNVRQTWMELLTYSKINFDAKQIIDKENKSIRKTLESWLTAIGNNTNNISKPLPQQYYVIL
jgi:predicted membrane chloride channel (bestrophin family)